MTIPLNKQLLPVYDKPLIYYPLSVLMLAGVREVLILSTPRDLPAFQHLLGDGTRWGMSFQYLVQPRPEGLPQAYTLGEDFLDGKPSMMILGDNLLYGARLTEHLEAAGSEGGAGIFGYRVKNPEEFGVVTLDSAGRPIALVEKPRPSPSPWAVVGLYLLDGDAPRRARGLTLSARGEFEMVDLLRSYMEEGRLRVEPLGRGVSWLDTGTPRSLLQAAQFVEVLQERQGLQVASPEEIAFRMGYIDGESLLALARPLQKSSYGEYLRRLVEEESGDHV